MSLQLILLSLVAAFIAGIMNAAAGGGAFLTYPMLLLMGNTSIVANATSTVILWPGVLASLSGYRKEVRQNKKWMTRLVIPALIGGIIGSHLLIRTPDNVFALVAPVLIALGSIILLYQKEIHRYFHRFKFDKASRRIVVVSILVFFISIYGAYFGAGIGILLIGILTILGIGNIYCTIALKNEIALVVNFVAATYFISSGLIHWQAVPIMAAGSIAGGYTGAKWVHHMNRTLVQRIVVALGFIIAILLFINRIKH